MKTTTTARLWLAAGLLALPAWAPALEAPPAKAEGGEEPKAQSHTVGAAAVRLEQGVRFYVDGLALDDIKTWLWNSKDISKAVEAALADGSASASDTPSGFKLEWRYPPQALNMGVEGRLGLKAKNLDIPNITGPASAACPSQTAFGDPTAPPLAADATCLYERENCERSGKAQSLDFPGHGDVLAVAAGMVARVELMGRGDMGKGTNLLVRHLLPGPGCPAVYSSYAHFDALALGIALNTPVSKGQVLGSIGGSGHGKRDAYSPHLRLEFKAAPGDAELLGEKPDAEGRLDPASFLGKNFAVAIYQTIVKGADHSCALKKDETLSCWGENDYGQATPPPGTFKQVSVGGRHTCALKPDFGLACWGWNGYGQARPPIGSFTQVSAGGRHGCALKGDGGVSCWGNNWWGQTTVPGAGYKQISAGGFHTCAIRADDTLICWGNDTKGQASAPAGAYKQVAAGAMHTCAITSEDALACWGDNGRGQSTPPEGSFKQLSSYGDYNCATRKDGFAMCWGEEPKPAKH